MALDPQAALVTSDPALLSLLWAEHGYRLALPDSAGITWAPPTGGDAG